MGIERLKPQVAKIIPYNMRMLMTNAYRLLALPLAATLALAAFLAGWGGLSVWFQTLSVLEGSRLKASLYLTGRLLCAGIAAGIAYVGGMVVM